ncbi:MAG: putative DNA binding domain-containing protein [Legionellales bacterium]|nr:putative DNA binding domain-containing protein [Legionellales bacterium]
MTIIRSNQYLMGIVKELRKLPNETEWIEFKENNEKPEEIGEYISALANSAALAGKVNAYIIWGVANDTHDVIGTTFKPDGVKIGNEELENWLIRLLSPKINFHFYTLDFDEFSIVLLEIGAAFRHPVRFKNDEFIRVGSYKKKLKDHPEKERELWRAFEQSPFEKEIAAENISAEEVLRLLNYPAYFYLTKSPLPENRTGILEALKAEEMIVKSKSENWNITNFGAVLFAKKLSDFSHLRRKSVRLIQYKGTSKLETIREELSDQGYAVGYELLIKAIMQLIPSNEIIGQAFRKEISMFPELAIRELVANAIIHQDFHIRGTSIMIELFSSRIEITNPGLPLVDTDRFLDYPPKSRNEAIASFMRRIGICEERGTGIDKVISQIETYHLPAPRFETTAEHTRITLFERRPFKDMSKTERLQACYQHAALRYIDGEYMTNTTLRERFDIEPKNSAMVSRVISDAINEGLVKRTNEDGDSKARKYLPWWA